MPDPVQTALVPLNTVEDMLSKYVATPTGTTVATLRPSPAPAQIAAANPSDFLKALGGILKVTYSVGEIEKVGNSVADGLKQAADALVLVADELGKLAGFSFPNNVTPLQLIQHLKSALALAQTLLPGGTPGLAAGSQFFDQLATLLDAVGGKVADAQVLLYRFAQELLAVRNSIKKP